jgi:predicted dehydrogenase
MSKIKVGVIGCGKISSIYLENLKTFEVLEVVACADLNMEVAKAKAAEFKIPKAITVQELLKDPEIQIVVNLTIPQAHAEIAMAALEAGKSVYTEKPFTVFCPEAKKVMELAKKKNLRVACAPDTVLGGGIQTARKLIDDGAIGFPVAATAFLMNHGHEHWHPNPGFYYQVGGGPMFDMGPYYLSTLFNLIGPVTRVSGSARISFPERTISSEPKKGQKIKVEVPTHITGVLDFESGAVGTIITSFDVWQGQLPCIEIYGSEGTMEVPNPNNFTGPVKIRKERGELVEVPLTHSYGTKNFRGMGVADLAHAIRSGRPHRASGEIAYHAMEVMHGFHEASKDGKYVKIESRFDRPKPLPIGLVEGTLDD